MRLTVSPKNSRVASSGTPIRVTGGGGVNSGAATLRAYASSTSYLAAARNTVHASGTVRANTEADTRR
jgi:hypothetical protein